ncbi:MAG: ABC transporter permease [Thermoleophilaceae bacterium]
MTGTAGLWWLARRETLRVSKLWTQTVLAPVISSTLFIVVFGLSLGGRIRQVDGFPYREFIVPGLIAMAMVQAAYNNNASSIFQARFDRYVHDVLSAPMRAWHMNVGFNVGGFVRALMIGAAMLVLAVPLTGVPVHEPLELVVAVVLALVLFSAFGTVVGIYAQTWDHTTFVSNILILPLTFLGGVFYSVDILPAPWHELSHFNPMFYLVQSIRYGFLGTSDVSVWLALAVTAGLAIPAFLWSHWLFATGRKLKA